MAVTLKGYRQRMVLNVITAVATVVAGGAALITVIYARRTVLDGRDAHSEEMADGPMPSSLR